MPISDELHDLVGNPVPSGDLGRRARERATEIKRRRLAGVTTSVVAVAVLAVPGALLVRDQSGTANGGVGAGSAEPSAAATSTAVPVVAGRALMSGTTVVPQSGEWGAADKARFAHALALLGTGFTQTGTGVVQDSKAGTKVGVEATFTAIDGGGTVTVQWLDATLPGGIGLKSTATVSGGANASGAALATALSQSGAGTISIKASGAPSEAAAPTTIGAESGLRSATSATTGGSTQLGEGQAITGLVTTDGKLEVSVDIVQGKPGSPKILPDKTGVAFANALIKAG